MQRCILLKRLVWPLYMCICTYVRLLLCMSLYAVPSVNFHKGGVIFTSQARCTGSAGPIVTLRFCVCLFVRLSQCGDAWELVTGGQLARFELANLFASTLQKEVKRCQYVRSKVEAQLSLHKFRSAPEARERQENGAANYKPYVVRNCKLWGYSTLCPVSEHHDPVASQR